MEKYVQGDQEAFRILFARYAPVLMGMMSRRLHSEAEARDLVQQTFLQLHRARLDFKLDCALKPYLFTIAMNLLRARHRAKGRRPELSLEPVELNNLHDAQSAQDRSAQLEQLEGAELAGRVRAAVKTLPQDQREVIELHWFEDRPFREVANVVGASLSAVKVRAHRGYNRLRGLLKETPETA